MANQIGEIAENTGTAQEWETFVRAEFPQCIARDENGDEVVPFTVRSAYSHDVGVHYIAQVLFTPGEYDQDGNEISPPVTGGQALMPDWHKEPESSQQDGRMTARFAIIQALDEIRDIPPNQDVRELLAEALVALQETGYPGMSYVVARHAWSRPATINGGLATAINKLENIPNTRAREAARRALERLRGLQGNRR